MKVIQENDDNFVDSTPENNDPCYKRQLVIPYEHNQDLKNHKYSGTDAGIAYKHFWSPLANWAVQKLPESLAPNTITLIGFLHGLLPLIILYSCVGLQMVGEVPQWFFFLQFYCFFMYRLFDEMDGKQARRTMNSSPLGLLFDHGFDCFMVLIQTLINLTMVQCGNNNLALMTLLTAYLAFHLATLEEYYVGTLYLPIVNAVSEGSLLLLLLTLVSGIIGNGFWATEVADISAQQIPGVSAITVGQITMIALTLFSFIQAMYYMFNIIGTVESPRETQSEVVKGRSLALQFISFFIFGFMWLSMGQVGSSPLAGVPEDPTKPAQTQAEIDALGLPNFILFMFFYGLVCVHQTISIQVAHVTRQKYQPLTKIYIFAMVSIITVFVLCANMDVDMSLYIRIEVTLIAIFQWCFILKTVQEISKILDIKVFQVRDKQLVQQLLQQEAMEEEMRGFDQQTNYNV